jgi:putative ABC transport system permease protein
MSLHPDSPQRREVTDEVAFHIDMRTRELIQRGIDPATARAQAEAQFAGRPAVEAACADLARRRDRRRLMRELAAGAMLDVRYALRRLWRSKRAGAITVLTMALGIGAATSIYSVVDSVLLKPLPFPDPDRIVSIWLTDERWRTDPVLSAGWDRIPIGRYEYDPLIAQTKALAEAGLWLESSVMMSRDDGPLERLRTIRATASLLPLLRVVPVRGRLFRPGEDVLNGPKVALLSWETWQGRFNGDERTVGRSIVLDDVPYEVVGILPPGVRVNRASLPPALWVPALQQTFDLPEQRNRSYRALGRLAADATLTAAQQEAAGIFHGTVKTTAPVGARVEPWQRDETRMVRASMVMLVGAVALLLTIACVNVAMVTIAESLTREREMASRAALGAGAGRLVRQLVTESIVLAAVAAPLGWALAWIGVTQLVALAPAAVPGLSDAALNVRALLFAAAVVGVTGVIVGLVPAFVIARRDVTLASPGVRQTSRGAARLQSVLMCAEVALSVVLLVGCGLLGHSLVKLRDVDVGFDADHLSVVQIAATGAFWRADDRVEPYFTTAVQEIAAVPGVTGVTQASAVPFGSGASSSPILVEGGDGTGRSTQQRRVGVNYFDVTRTPILAGRAFAGTDTASAELVAIVSRSAARRDFGDASPLGRKVRWQGKWRTIVGVAGDVLFSRMSDPVQPTIYIPTAQSPDSQVLIVRTAPQAPGVPAAIRERLAALDRAAAVQRIDDVPDLIARSYGEERYRATLVTMFGVLASLLAAVGMFAVASRSVAARQREAGIRVALGGSAAAIARAMTRDLTIGIVVGLAAGFGAGVVLSRWLAPQLFGVGTLDAAAFGGAVLVMMLAVVVALIAPLRRAIRVDPVVALRAD